MAGYQYSGIKGDRFELNDQCDLFVDAKGEHESHEDAYQRSRREKPHDIVIHLPAIYSHHDLLQRLDAMLAE